MAHNNLVSAQNISTGLSGPETDPPIYGILTRTLIHSPVVKQIVPARIRRRELNDVVFIGVSSVPVSLGSGFFIHRQQA